MTAVTDELTARAAALGMRDWPSGITTNQARQEMLDWAERNRLRYSERGTCLHWLTQGRCTDNTCLGTQIDPSWMDHLTGWVRDRKPAVLVSQPYELSAEGLEQLVALNDAWGVRVHVTGLGWYGHGTVLVTVWA